MSKHTWTEQEYRIVCVCYKEKIPIDLALFLTNTNNRKSMEMRYQNCMFLDKGRIDGSLSHPPRSLAKAWEEVNTFYPISKKTEETDWESLVLSLMFGSFVFQLVSILMTV
jgi:hypothetical protein